MIRKFFSSPSASITGAAITLGAASFVSRAIGIIRDRIFAHTFGAGELLDAYYAAFRIPDLVYNLLVLGALSAGFIPIFLELLERNKTHAWRTVNIVMNLLGVVLVVVCAALFFATPLLLRKFLPGFSAEQLLLASRLTRTMLLSPILLGVSSIVSSILQSFKLFFIYSLAPIVYNVGIIIGAVAFVPIFGPQGLAYGVILGCLLHLGIQLPALFRTGFRYAPTFRPDAAVRKIAAHILPRTLSLAAHQVNFLAATALASSLPVGSISVFNFATNLQYLPVGIIGVSFAMAALPTLSAAAAKKNMNQFVEQLGTTTRVMMFFILPLTVLFLLLRAQIVRVVLGSGGFDWTATVQTADTLAFFSLSLFAQCLVILIVRAFFALQDTWTPLAASIVTMITNVLLMTTLQPILGVAGLALAISLATMLQLALLWLLLRRKVGGLEEGRGLTSLYKISAAALLMAVVIQMLKTPIAGIVDMTRFWGIATQATLAGIAGLLVYAAVCYLLHLEEILHLQKSFRRRFMKIREVQSEILDVDPNG